MDKKCPICGMNGKIPAHGKYFCSEHCVKKFEKEENISKDEEYCPSCSVQKKIPFYRQKLFIVTLFATLVVGISYFHPLTRPFFYAFVDYLELIWWAILLGFLIGGIIDYFIPRKYIEKYLSRHRKRTILYSIIF